MTLTLSAVFFLIAAILSAIAAVRPFPALIPLVLLFISLGLLLEGGL